MADGGPTVLLVDDDDLVREIASEALSQMGYQVIEASGGDAALRVLAGRPEIRLLFTDVIMPGMDGFVLAHEAKRLHPNLRVIYTSGYLKNVPWGQHGIGYGPMVEKPWNLEHLRTVVRRAFDEPEPQAC